MLKSRPLFSNQFIFPALLLFASTIWRFVLAGSIDLGNDEVYYLSYARAPQWSYFDHPLLTGLLINFSTMRFSLCHEFYYRLGPLLLGTMNTMIVYHISKQIGDEKTGWISALLFTGSLYTSVIAGSFILPDAIELTCWLMVIMSGIRQLNENEYNPNRWILIGIWTGIGILSKYHIILLWPCFLLFGFLQRRIWFRHWQFYAAILIFFLFTLPILLWNSENNWISFTFHSDRVSFDLHNWRPNYFFQELGGAFFYNNPINFVLIIWMLVRYFKNRILKDNMVTHFIIFCSLPIALLFLVVASTRRTLPHWSAPAYTMLLIPVSVFLGKRNNKITGVVFSSVFFYLLITFTAFGSIRFGWMDSLLHPPDVNIIKASKNDLSLDMYGWDEAGQAFSSIRKKLIDKNIITEQTVVIQDKWFPGAHIDEYLVRHANGRTVFTGSLEDIHHFAWINKKNTLLEKGDSAIYIIPARYYKDPQSLTYFESNTPLDTISIHRRNRIISQLYIFKMKNFRGQWVSTPYCTYLKN